MAKYGKKAQRKVARAMRERKEGTLTSGKSGLKVTSRKQAIAIGLSEARREGAKVPKKSAKKRPAKVAAEKSRRPVRKKTSTRKKSAVKKSFRKKAS